MADTREIEYTLVPRTKGKSDLWKLFTYVSGRQTDKLILMLLYVNSAIPLSNLREVVKHVNAYEAPPPLSLAAQ